MDAGPETVSGAGTPAFVEEAGPMIFEKSYSSYEEFEREELRKMERLDVSFEEILSEFDTIDDRPISHKGRRDGLFDAYANDEDADDDEGSYEE